jgi:hypothetical protein
VRVAAPSLWLRVALPAVATVLLGLAGHTLSGGAPPLAVALPALLPLLVVARLLARREMALGSLVVFLLVGQGWVHLLASSCGHGSAVPDASMVGAHVAAAAAVGLLLRAHEARAWTSARVAALGRLVTRLVAHGTTTLVTHVRPVLVSIATADLSATAAHLARLPERRGPPLQLAA